jgi:hypothetical protein
VQLEPIIRESMVIFWIIVFLSDITSYVTKAVHAMSRAVMVVTMMIKVNFRLIEISLNGRISTILFQEIPPGFLLRNSKPLTALNSSARVNLFRPNTPKLA